MAATAAEASSSDWYFDFVSPFAYFAWIEFQRAPFPGRLRLRPVLFAGLLAAWGHKGPAEIPEKRRHTYRFCQWYSERHGIAFHMPAAHPFNPLRALRLAHALGATPVVVDAIFKAIWAEGSDPATEHGWRSVAATVGLPQVDAATLAASPDAKRLLRAETDAAIAAGVFGVPTLAVRGELFWGVDSLPMARDFAFHPKRFAEGEFARLAHLPVGAARSQKR